jgi:alkylated DNA repair protein alkB family protein 1
VNYYHMDSTLAGHTDHSELNKEAPLFSFRWFYLISGESQ